MFPRFSIISLPFLDKFQIKKQGSVINGTTIPFPQLHEFSEQKKYHW